MALRIFAATLKARICRSLNWSEFPGTGGEFKGYESFRTHDLDVLLRLSGQEGRIKQNHFELWNRVAVWRPESRYNMMDTVSAEDGRGIVEAEELLRVL